MGGTKYRCRKRIKAFLSAGRYSPASRSKGRPGAFYFLLNFLDLHRLYLLVCTLLYWRDLTGSPTPLGRSAARRYSNGAAS
jgi:hypothetical protein